MYFRHCFTASSQMRSDTRLQGRVGTRPAPAALEQHRRDPEKQNARRSSGPRGRNSASTSEPQIAGAVNAVSFFVGVGLVTAPTSG
jgi:hypothetical protein